MINSPGEMTALIRIQYKKLVGTGSFATETWLDIGNEVESDAPRWTYAKWEGLHGKEVWAASSVQAMQAATVGVWFDTCINQKCRVVDDAGVIYDIVSCDDVRKRHQQLELKVKASVNGSA